MRAYNIFVSGPKLREATPPTPKVESAQSANLLKFKLIFDPPLSKNCRGTPVPGGGALARISHSL